MFFIKAVNLVLEQIDAQLREKLALGAHDTLSRIEHTLSSPLMSTPLKPLDPTTPEPTESKEPPATPSSLSSTAPETREEIDGELKFGISWLKFINLSAPAFGKIMADNLKNNPVASNKLLILFRLRIQIEKAKNQAYELLIAKDIKPKGSKAGDLAKSADCIDSNLLAEVVKYIKESDILVQRARILSETSITVNFAYKCSIGDTETLLEKSLFLLVEYACFCKTIDQKTKREPGHLYGFRDLSPHALKSKDFVIQSHIKMNDYILHNFDVHSQYGANQKRGGSLAYFTSFLPGYDPKITVQKREQVIDFFVALKDKITVLQAEKASKAEIEEAVLSCIDIHYGHVQTLTPSYSYSPQRVEEYYSALHRELMSQTSSDGHSSKCLASKLLKSSSVV